MEQRESGSPHAIEANLYGDVQNHVASIVPELNFDPVFVKQRPRVGLHTQQQGPAAPPDSKAPAFPPIVIEVGFNCAPNTTCRPTSTSTASSRQIRRAPNVFATPRFPGAPAARALSIMSRRMSIPPAKRPSNGQGERERAGDYASRIPNLGQFDATCCPELSALALHAATVCQ